MPDELIAIIDMYVHLSGSIVDAMYVELDTHREPPPAKNLWFGPNRRIHGIQMNKWVFYGDVSNNSGFDMGRIGCNLIGETDIECKLVAGFDESGQKVIRVSVNGDMVDRLKWDGPGLTPFSRINRNHLRYSIDLLQHTQVTGINRNPFDVMCDGAHAAIWSWFHGGDPTTGQKISTAARHGRGV